jgi:hypothetical protein
MTIRKGRLWKQCKRCGKIFEPTGFRNKICPDCCINNWGKNLKKWTSMK